MSNQLSLKIILLLSFLLTGVIYWGGLHGPFLLDDLQTISIAKVSSWQFFEVFSVITANESGPLFRPVSILSFVITDALFGSETFGYKWMNLMLHLTCGMMCFLVLRKLIHLFAKDYPHALALAVLTTLVWLIHPLLVSTTLYAVQRMAILSALFVLSSLLIYLKVRFEAKTLGMKALGFTSFFTCFGLAVLSKENALLLPFFIALIECMAWMQGYQNKKYLLGILSLSFLIILGGAIYYLSHWDSFSASFAAKGFTLLEYIQVQLKALVFYLKLIVTPSLQPMGLYHDDFATAFVSPTWLNASLLLGLILLAAYKIKSMPLFSFGIFWFFVAHSMESTILPLEPVFEHRNYLASLGILLPMAYLVIQILNLKAFKKYGLVVPVLWVGLFAFVTIMRVDTWSSPQKFLAMANKNHPHSARTHIETANYLFNLKAYDAATLALNQADALSPHNSGPKLHQVLAHCFIQAPLENLLNEAALSLKTKEVTPYTILVFDALVQNHFNQQCQHVSVEQTQQLMSYALQNPHIQTKPRYLATLKHLEAGLNVKQNNLSKAVENLSESYQLNPARIEPLIEKTQLLIYQGNQAQVKEHLKWIENHPQFKVKTNQEKWLQLKKQVE